jgi:hypothetical protein
MVALQDQETEYDWVGRRPMCCAPSPFTIQYAYALDACHPIAD